ncbi:MBL fold metallo-hydrolase [Pseudonocardia sp. H11422]|uniref:MBL fold metallo-hydrolase n=1 Tax=Pseudonocardia sp. H11422 TaxID=2835866 RepID=UPI0027E262BA|nr:MBL fold metallo-hydrolase [Pseudonocardia sp. H11422]
MTARRFSPTRPLLYGGTLMAAATALRAAHGVPASMGASRAALTAGTAAAAGRAHVADGVFRNTEPSALLHAGSAGPVMRALIRRGRTGRPARPVPLAPVDVPGTAGTLAATWYGHSTVLIEIDGRRVLADPVWSDRVSPSRLLGPRRLHPVPAPLDGLPPVDAVVISHDHYDHLDLPTVRALLRAGSAPFVVPLGIGAHLRRWGVPGERVVELDWNESATIAGLTLSCTEARHFSGRSLRRNTTLWSSWVIAGPAGRQVFFGGDTGYTAAFARINDRFGPFALTLLPIGAYSEQWPDLHMTPEESVRAHRDLGGGLLLPVHWATFNLGFHPWSEPVDRLRAAAESLDIPLAIPRPGERIDVAAPPPMRDWWTPIA